MLTRHDPRARDFWPTMSNTAQSLIRVLIVEDEPKLRDSLVEGLRLEEWAVIGVGTDTDAWRYLEAENFNLIVLDRMLPDGDGLDFVHRLRAQQKNTPVLMISACSRSTTKEVVLQAGATGFLAKPFSFDDLLHQARALLRIAA